MPFVIFDPHLGGYYKTFTRRVGTVRAAKVWQRSASAIVEAGMVNIPRSVPPGHVPSHEFQDLPKAFVVEVDENFLGVRVYAGTTHFKPLVET